MIFLVTITQPLQPSGQPKALHKKISQHSVTLPHNLSNPRGGRRPYTKKIPKHSVTYHATSTTLGVAEGPVQKIITKYPHPTNNIAVTDFTDVEEVKEALTTRETKREKLKKNQGS